MSKKSEKKDLENKMEIFEKYYLIKAKGEQNIGVYTQNDILYISPGENSNIEEITIREDIKANLIRATKDFVTLKIGDQIYKIIYDSSTASR